MKQIILAVIIGSLLVGCASTRHNKTAETNNTTDSIRIVSRNKILYIPDTVYIEIPAQTAERTTQEDTSHLENEYAMSDALINPNGTLYHILTTKPHIKPIPTKKQIQYRDSIVYRDKIKTETIVETKYIEPNLSLWQKIRLKTWSFLLITLVVFIGFTFKKQIKVLLRFFIKQP